MPYIDPNFEARRKSILGGGSAQGQQPITPIQRTGVVIDKAFDERRKLILANPLPQIKIEPLPEPQQQPGFIDKTKKFLGISTGELQAVGEGIKQKVTTYDYKNAPSDIWNVTKATYGKIKQVIGEETEKQAQKEKQYRVDNNIPDYQNLDYTQVRDLSSVGMLKLAKEDVELDLQNLKGKEKKSWLDEYRIKNLENLVKDIDETLALPPEQRIKKEALINGLAIGRVTGNLSAGFLGALEGVGDFIRWRADVAEAEGLSRFSESAARRVESWAKEVAPNNPELGDELLQGVGSTLTFYIPGAGISSASVRLASISPKLATVFGVTASATLEAATESGNTYQTMIETGATREEADLAASRVFAGNIFYNIASNKVGIFSDSQGVKKAIASAMAEGTQEAFQDGLQSIAQKEDIDPDQLAKTFFIGSVVGGGMGSVIQQASVNEEVNPQDREKLKKLAEELKEVENGADPEALGFNFVDTKSGQEVASSGIQLADQNVYAQLSNKELEYLKDEVGNLDFTATDKPHLTPIEKLRNSEMKLVTLDEIRALSPSIDQAFQNMQAQESKQEFDYSSTQLDLPTELANSVISFAQSIPESSLSKDPTANYGAQKTGRETEPHITVLYGLSTTNEAAVRKLVESVDPIEVELGEISAFTTNEDYDVLKIDVKSKQLDLLNAKLDNALKTPGKTFDQYRPHITIAYLQKGEAAKFVGDNRFKGQKITLSDLTFSSKDGKRINIPLLGKTDGKGASGSLDQTKVSTEKYPRTLNLQDKSDIEYLKRIFSDESVEDMKKGIFKYGRREGKAEIESIVKHTIIDDKKATAANLKQEVKDLLSKSKKVITKKLITVYHGGNKSFTDSLLEGKGFDPEAKREAGTGGNFYGLSTTTNREMASNFSTSATGDPSVVELQISEGARALELSNKEGEFVDEYSEAALKELAKDYDIIIDKNNAGGESEIRVLNPDILEQTKIDQPKPKEKAKSRLKDYPGVLSGLTSKGGAEKIHNFELRKPPKAGTEEFKLHKKIVGLIRKYAQTIGEGYTPRNALGVYFPKTKNIRINNINNVTVAAHEIAHFLDYANNITDKLLSAKDKTIQSQIEKIYQQYYPTARPDHQKRLQALEGFATLLQKYTEQPTTITNEYPDLVKEFLQPGGKYYHKVVGEILTDLNQMIGEYQGLSALDKIGARVTSEGTNINKESFLNFWQKLRTQIADEVYPVEVLAKKGKVGFTKEDPSLWVRAYNSISGIVNNNISTDRGYWAFTDLQNGFQKKYDFNWKTLVESTQRRGITDSFAHYLVARREYYLYQELDQLKAQRDVVEKIYKAFEAVKPDEMDKFDRDMRATLSEDYGIDLTETEYQKAKKKIKALFEQADKAYQELNEILENDGFKREDIENAYTENKDTFKDEETMFDALTREDLNLLYNPEVQLIDRKKYARLIKRDGYASFKRQFYDEIVGDVEAMGSVKVGSTKVSSMIGRTGSERTIINPLYSALANHSEITRKAMKQVVYNQMGKLGSSALMPNLMQQVPLKTAVDKNTGAITYPQEKDNNVIMSRQNYKRVPILMDGEIKTMIDNLLSYKNIDVFTQLYAGLSRTFTAGTTALYPQFALTNFVVDQITATANSYNGYKALYSPMKDMLTVLRKKGGVESKYYEEYLVMGGERQTFTGWQRLEPNDLFKRIAAEKKIMEKAVDSLQKGVDILSIPAAKSEIFSRATEYINARKAGKSQIVALEEAGRVTAPFHHIGSWGAKSSSKGFGRRCGRGLPFFNATIQVLDQQSRVLGTPEGRKRATFVTIAITAAYLAAITAMMDATDDQKEQYKDLEAQDLANFIYFPNPSGEGLIRVKMANTFSIPGAVMNMVIANKMFGANYGARDVVEASTAFLPDQFNPTNPTAAILGWIPQVFKPVAHVIFNVKEYPKVTRLVGMGLERKPPELQFNEGTSVFAKKLGELLKVSPIKVDYLLTGYLGRASGFLTGKPGIYNPAASIMRDYYFTSGKRVREFYDLKEKNDAKYTAYQNYEKGYENLDQKQVKEIYRVRQISDEIDKLLGEYRDLDAEKNQEKAAEVRAKILLHIENLNDGTTPSNNAVWSYQANKRRIKNKMDKK